MIDGVAVGTFLGFLIVEVFWVLYALAAWNIRRYKKFK